MACCKCCCGNKTCAEGEIGKCCCGGPTGSCCTASQYCCSGTCQSTPCTGACCDPVFGCLQYDEAGCASVGGTWLGYGIPCDPNPCPGACCDTLFGNCDQATKADCEANGRTFIGDGIPCSPDPCGGYCVSVSDSKAETFDVPPSVCCNRGGTPTKTVRVPSGFSTPCRIRITGTVDDDLLVNGSLIEAGLYPTGPWSFCDPQPNCNGGHTVGGAGSGKWVMEVGRTFTVAAQDNLFGGTSYNLTICFGVNDSLSAGNPLP